MSRNTHLKMKLYYVFPNWSHKSDPLVHASFPDLMGSAVCLLLACFAAASLPASASCPHPYPMDVDSSTANIFSIWGNIYPGESRKVFCRWSALPRYCSDPGWWQEKCQAVLARFDLVAHSPQQLRRAAFPPCPGFQDCRSALWSLLGNNKDKTVDLCVARIFLASSVCVFF